VWSFVSWDVIFPITYAVFLSALYLWAGRCRRVLPSQLRESPHKGESHRLRAKKIRGYTPPALESSLVVLPFACAAFDICGENLPLFYAALRPHTRLASVAVMAGSVGAALKWTLLSLFAIGLLDTLLRGPRGQCYGASVSAYSPWRLAACRSWPFRRGKTSSFGWLREMRRGFT
jgi:hypothetical protein